MSLEVYAGPTDLPLPGRGTISSRMLLRLERAARSTISCLGFGCDSGSIGMREGDTERNLAIESRSARSHASTARTATRKHSLAALVVNQFWHSCGAQDASWSKSTSTTHGRNLAELL